MKLDVEGSTNAIIKMNSTGGTGGRMDFAHGGTNYGNVGSGKNILGIGNAADMMVNADSVLYLGVGAQTITVKSGGNVGIGTTSPGAQLHNYSTSTQNVWLSGYGTLAQNTWGAGHGIFAAADNGLLISKANAANDTNRLFSFYHDAGGNAEMYMYNTGMTNTVKIDSSGVSYLNGGNVGIGTTSPQNLLNLSQAAGANIRFDNPTTSNYFIIGEGVGTNNVFSFRGNSYRSTDTLSIDFANNRVGVGAISPDATFQVGNGTC